MRVRAFERRKIAATVNNPAANNAKELGSGTGLGLNNADGEEIPLLSIP